MYAGKIVENGSKEDVLLRPKHPYTKLLIKALPKIDGNKKIEPIEGSVFSAYEKEKICLFYERCPFRKEICSLQYPEDIVLDNNQTVSCHLYKTKKTEKKWIEDLSFAKT